jgi:NAD(P)-dependent dehydrogenase (short-subunit alcohol dehydrogenase family)
MGRLDGKVAAITGAASGIGRGSAFCLAREGAAVVAADLNSQGGEQVIAEIAAMGGRAVFQHTDVTNEADVQAVTDRAIQEYGRLDVMFNNAGLAGAFGQIEAVNTDDWDKTMAVLLGAVFFGIKYAVPPMRKIGGGSIISTSSVASYLPAPNAAAYSAAKGGVISLTRAAALELGATEFASIASAPARLTLRYGETIQPASRKPWTTFSRFPAWVGPRTSPRWPYTSPAMNPNG